MGDLEFELNSTDIHQGSEIIGPLLYHIQDDMME